MVIKLDFLPDLVGVWGKGKEESVNPLEGDYSIFLMYLGDIENSEGRIIDNLGLANIFEYSRTPTEISFAKEYSQQLPNTGQHLEGRINYSGKGGMNFYNGGWKKDKDKGIFHLGDRNYVMGADNPIARSFIRFETTRLISILKKMQRESPFLPVIPEDHIVNKL